MKKFGVCFADKFIKFRKMPISAFSFFALAYTFSHFPVDFYLLQIIKQTNNITPFLLFFTIKQCMFTIEKFYGIMAQKIFIKARCQGYGRKEICN